MNGTAEISNAMRTPKKEKLSAVTVVVKNTHRA